MSATEATIWTTFKRLEACAVIGARCPINDIGVNKYAMHALAHRGAIRIEIYAGNWRVIEILHGPHAGQRTAGPPNGGALYRMVDADGARYIGRSPNKPIPREPTQRIAP